MEKVVRTEEEWKQLLPDLAFRVMRKHGTEHAFTNDNFPKAPGQFHCRGCGAALFDADTKFDSGTGWPSFFAPISDTAVETQEDRTLWMRRTEVHCATCDGHLGHVFPDGPAPTGLRYCMNGVALTFEEK